MNAQAAEIFEEQIICRGGTASTSSWQEIPRSSRAVFSSTTLNRQCVPIIAGLAAWARHDRPGPSEHWPQQAAAGLRSEFYESVRWQINPQPGSYIKLILTSSYYPRLRRGRRQYPGAGHQNRLYLSARQRRRRAPNERGPPAYTPANRELLEL